MAEKATLLKVKKGLRTSHSVLDEDIMADIDACLADLKIARIIDPKETDPLIYNAIKLYCRSLYTDDPAKGAEYLRRYEALKSNLQTAEGYGWKADSEEGAADE